MTDRNLLEVLAQCETELKGRKEDFFGSSLCYELMNRVGETKDISPRLMDVKLRLDRKERCLLVLIFQRMRRKT